MYTNLSKLDKFDKSEITRTTITTTTTKSFLSGASAVHARGKKISLLPSNEHSFLVHQCAPSEAMHQRPTNR